MRQVSSTKPPPPPPAPAFVHLEAVLGNSGMHMYISRVGKGEGCVTKQCSFEGIMGQK